MDDMEPLWVVGNEFHDGSFKRRGLDGKTVSARLVREPKNAFDKNAVGVHVGKTQVGHLSSARAEKVASWIDAAGGSFDTTLTYRDGGADVLVPESWVVSPRAEKVTLQQAKKNQNELAVLGVGDHKCKVVTSGEQMNVTVDDVVVGRLYPKQLDQSTLDKIVHNRLQKLVVEASTFNEGLFARIVIPAADTPKPPVSVARGPASFSTQKAVVRPPETAGIKSFLKGIFSR